MSLSLCFHVCVGVFVCVCAAIYSRDVEVNDLRISREKCIISVKTARRFPAGIGLWDLMSGEDLRFQPHITQDRWIHALELTGKRSVTEVVAVGERSSDGTFSILLLDMRTQQKIVHEIAQNKQMLWPLRVHDVSVFCNVVARTGEKWGRIRQIDLRYAPVDRSPDPPSPGPIPTFLPKPLLQRPPTGLIGQPDTSLLPSTQIIPPANTVFSTAWTALDRTWTALETYHKKLDPKPPSPLPLAHKQILTPSWRRAHGLHPPTATATGRGRGTSITTATAMEDKKRQSALACLAGVGSGSRVVVRGKGAMKRRGSTDLDMSGDVKRRGIFGGLLMGTAIGNTTTTAHQQYQEQHERRGSVGVGGSGMVDIDEDKSASGGSPASATSIFGGFGGVFPSGVMNFGFNSVVLGPSSLLKAASGTSTTSTDCETPADGIPRLTNAPPSQPTAAAAAAGGGTKRKRKVRHTDHGSPSPHVVAMDVDPSMGMGMGKMGVGVSRALPPKPDPIVTDPHMSPLSSSCLREGLPFSMRSCQNRAGITHFFPWTVEDFRVTDKAVYGLTKHDGRIAVYRARHDRPGRGECLGLVDQFNSVGWNDPLQIIQLHETGLIVSVGENVYVADVCCPWPIWT
uniref:Uncharacterized protein n=1 Tax=Vitrella brassicaformis TaxID=1169539 RepID=A0A7S1JX79_9ALVE|mmetsp:Transcript_27863/g.69563  ORF Transcript_27863/g.69563 Transcript_27863/m.69563 type:complete len:626 (+) Transcript_27863:868-2745(+)